MPKLQLLILDAGVVIKLHELGLWNKVIERCDVYLSSIVAYREVRYHQAENDEWGQDIDLSSAIASQQIKVFELVHTELAAFRSRFDESYFAGLDDGEAESLAYLVSRTEPFLVSSGDAIVYKVLGNLNRGEQGISLEEILASCGLSCRLDGFQYTQAFRERLSQQGARDMIQGIGRKSR